MEKSPLKEVTQAEDSVALSSCEDVLECIMKLNPKRVQSYRLLVKHGPMRASELGVKIGKERSTAYRYLMDLVSCGICVKRTKTIKGGGYVHIYEALPPEEVKVKLKACTDKWYRTMTEAIEGFPYE